MFDPKDMVEFLVDHINNGQLSQIFDNSDQSESFMNYTKKVMERPENRMVRKTNLRSSYSKVHVGNDQWEIKGDDKIYPKVVRDISAQAWDLLRQRNEAAEFKFRKDSFQEVLDTLELMSDEGYSTDEEAGREARRLFREAVTTLKYVMFNVSQEGGSFQE